MNYHTIYSNLILKSTNRQLDEFTETHHIVPKCLGGENDKSNLVELTPEEHYLAHQLLVKIYPNNKKLAFAAHMMTVGHTGIRTNKQYGWIKRKLSVLSSGEGNSMFGKKLSVERKKLSSQPGELNPFYGKKHTKETKEKISRSNKGKPGLVGEKNGMFGKKLSTETKEKISKNSPWTGTAGKGIHPNSGRIKPEAEKEHLRKLFAGVKLSEEHKKNMRKPKGPQQIVTCPHCNASGGISNFKRYHFDNCKGK